jgi:hypothetical protein
MNTPEYKAALCALESHGWGILTARERTMLAKSDITPTRAGVSQRTLNAWSRKGTA